MEYISGVLGTGLLWCMLFILGVILLLFWPAKEERRESALDVLHKKFAEGTLSVEQYQERRAVLEQDRNKYVS